MKNIEIPEDLLDKLQFLNSCISQVTNRENKVLWNGTFPLYSDTIMAAVQKLVEERNKIWLGSSNRRIYKMSHRA